MAARLFNAIGKLGLGIAVVGGVGQSALYNGMYIKGAFINYRRGSGFYDPPL